MHKICNYFVMFLGLFCLFFFTVDTIIDLNILKQIIITLKNTEERNCVIHFSMLHSTRTVSQTLDMLGYHFFTLNTYNTDNSQCSISVNDTHFENQ